MREWSSSANKYLSFILAFDWFFGFRVVIVIVLIGALIRALIILAILVGAVALLVLNGVAVFIHVI